MNAWARQVLWSGTLFLVAATWAPVPVTAAASQPAVRTVRGEVVAVNLTASPQVIVVKATTSGKEDMIVGATVVADTKVMRGTQAIGLEALKPGETVSLTYSRQKDGLVARSIQAP